MTRVAVAGASGRMGRMVVAALGESPDLHVHALLEPPGKAARAEGLVEGARVTDDPEAALDGADAYIDFSSPRASVALAQLAAARAVRRRGKIAAIIGTTGLGPEHHAALAACARRVPLVWSPNFSPGVNVLLGIAEQAARALGEGFDLEIVELHHRAKKDAPSGTALALGEALARGRDLDFGKARRSVRDGDVGARPAGEIGVMAVRGGDVIGEHTAFFFGPDERVELTHRAGSRMIFARGAVRAARWAAGRAAGQYGMRDVLGLG